jgi:hypothetical protein
MIGFAEWIQRPVKLKRKKKNEQRSSQTHGEGGDLDQQGEVAGNDSQVTQQTIHVFAVPEL